MPTIFPTDAPTDAPSQYEIYTTYDAILQGIHFICLSTNNLHNNHIICTLYELHMYIYNMKYLAVMTNNLRLIS